MKSRSPFDRSVFQFLTELGLNNEREWFNANKARYEESVREPSLAFIRAMRPHLKKISPHLVAIEAERRSSPAKHFGNRLPLGLEVHCSEGVDLTRAGRPHGQYSFQNFLIARHARSLFQGGEAP